MARGGPFLPLSSGSLAKTLPPSYAFSCLDATFLGNDIGEAGRTAETPAPMSLLGPADAPFIFLRRLRPVQAFSRSGLDFSSAVSLVAWRSVVCLHWSPDIDDQGSLG